MSWHISFVHKPRDSIALLSSQIIFAWLRQSIRGHARQPLPTGIEDVLKGKKRVERESEMEPSRTYYDVNGIVRQHIFLAFFKNEWRLCVVCRTKASSHNNRKKVAKPV